MRMITQTMIGAYERCRRFYYLKYLRELPWPAKTRDRQSMTEGADFHLLVRQLIMGLPEDSLVSSSEDPALMNWIKAWIRSAPLAGCEQVWAEKEVTAIFEDTLLMGKYDALVLTGDRLTIFDWKTTEHKPEFAVYASSPQTRLYRWLAKTAAPRLLGISDQVFPADRIEMVYWFPSFSDQPIRLPYSEQLWEEDETWLKMIIRELSLPNETDYPKTEKTRRCAYCGYFAYCHPDMAAGLRESGAEDPFGDAFPLEDMMPEEFALPDFSGSGDSEAVSF